MTDLAPFAALPPGTRRSALLPRPDRRAVNLGHVHLPEEAAPGGLLPELHLPPDALQTHLLVLGGTGTGKSKFLERLCREFVRLGEGFLFVDPHANTSRDLLAYLHHVEPLLDPFQRLAIHHLELTPRRLFALDPFVYPAAVPPPNAPERYEYDCWLKGQADRVKRAIVRQQGRADFEKTPRLSRFLEAAVYACGVAYDRAGSHIGLSELDTMLNPQHARFRGLFDRVALCLPEAVLETYKKLFAEKNPWRQEDRTESTVNALHQFLNPVTREIFAQRRPPFDVAAAMRQDGIVLCSFAEADGVSAEVADALGGLLIAQVFAATRTLRDDRRRQFHLVVDEAERFLGEDVARAMKELRKMKLSVCLSAQDLSCLRKGDDVDLVPEALSQNGVRVSFQQQNDEDAERLARALGYKNVSFAKLVHEVDRFDGYDWVVVPSVSVSASDSVTAGEGGTAGDTWSRSETDTRTETAQQSRSDMRGSADTRGRADTRSANTQERVFPNGRTEPVGRGRAAGASEQASHADTAATTLGETLGVSAARAYAASVGGSETASWNRNAAHTDGLSVGYSQSPLARHRLERQDSGRLVDAVNDQLAKMTQQFMLLPRQHCVVSVSSLPFSFVLRVHDVPDPFAGCPTVRKLAIAAMNRSLMASRAYLFDPVEERRAAAAAVPPDPSEQAVAPVRRDAARSAPLPPDNPYGQ